VDVSDRCVKGRWDEMARGRPRQSHRGLRRNPQGRDLPTGVGAQVRRVSQRAACPYTMNPPSARAGACTPLSGLLRSSRRIPGPPRRKWARRPRQRAARCV